MVIHQAFFSFCSNFLPTKIAIFSVILAVLPLKNVKHTKCVHGIRDASQKRRGTQKNRHVATLVLVCENNKKSPISSGKRHKIKTAEPILSDVSADIELCSESDRSMSHTTRGCDGRQEGCESGYYHLHRYLNNTIRLHNFHFSKFLDLKVKATKVDYKVQRLSSAPSCHRLSCLRCRHRCCCHHPGSGYRHSP